MFAELVGLALMAIVQIPAEAETTEAARQERLQFMKDKSELFLLSRAESPDTPLALKDEPFCGSAIPSATAAPGMRHVSLARRSQAGGSHLLRNSPA